MGEYWLLAIWLQGYYLLAARRSHFNLGGLS